MKRGLLFGLACFVVGAVLAIGTAWLVHGRNHKSQTTLNAEKYPLLSNRIFAENPNDILINFTPLRHSLEQQFDPLTTPFSFYFEYIPTGTSIRIASEQQLIAASLVKLPVVWICTTPLNLDTST